MGQLTPRSNSAGESRKCPRTPIFQVKKLRLMAAQEQSCLSTKPSPCPPHKAEGCERLMPARPGFRGRYGADGCRLQNPGPRRRGAPRPSPRARPPRQHPGSARLLGPGSKHTRAPLRCCLGHLTEMTNSCLPLAMKNILNSSCGVEWGGDHPRDYSQMKG